MRAAERIGFLIMMDKVADELAALVRSESAKLALTDEDAIDALWKVWDAVIQREREHRAEWVRAEMEGERIDAEARAAHPDDYGEWLDAQNAEIRDLLIRRARGLSGDG